MSGPVIARWRKSSRSMSDGHCVEVGEDWRKSSRSMSNGQCAEVASWRKPRRSVGNGACLEAGDGAAGVVVRDTKDRDGFVLAIPAGAWKVFTAGLKAGVS